MNLSYESIVPSGKKRFYLNAIKKYNLTTSVIICAMIGFIPIVYYGINEKYQVFISILYILDNIAFATLYISLAFCLYSAIRTSRLFYLNKTNRFLIFKMSLVSTALILLTLVSLISRIYFNVQTNSEKLRYFAYRDLLYLIYFLFSNLIPLYIFIIHLLVYNPISKIDASFIYNEIFKSKLFNSRLSYMQLT